MPAPRISIQPLALHTRQPEPRQVGRDIERLEVVAVQLDLRALSDLESHVSKNLQDPPQRLGNRMDAARMEAPGRESDVDPLSFELARESALVDLTLVLRVGSFD